MIAKQKQLNSICNNTVYNFIWLPIPGVWSVSPKRHLTAPAHSRIAQSWSCISDSGNRGSRERLFTLTKSSAGYWQKLIGVDRTRERKRIIKVLTASLLRYVCKSARQRYRRRFRTSISVSFRKLYSGITAELSFLTVLFWWNSFFFSKLSCFTESDKSTSLS